MNVIFLAVALLLAAAAGYMVLDDDVPVVAPVATIQPEQTNDAGMKNEPKINIEYNEDKNIKAEKKPIEKVVKKVPSEKKEEVIRKGRVIVESENIPDFIYENRLKEAELPDFSKTKNTNDRYETSVMAENVDLTKGVSPQVPIFANVETPSGEEIQVPITPELTEQNNVLFIYVKDTVTGLELMIDVTEVVENADSGDSVNVGADSDTGTQTKTIDSPPPIPPSIL